MQAVLLLSGAEESELFAMAYIGVLELPTAVDMP